MRGSPNSPPEASNKRRLLGRVILLAAVAVAFFPLFSSLGSEAALRFRLGDQHARFDELELRYFHEGDQVAGAHFTFPGGAPRTFDHTLSLPKGEVEVELTLTGEGVRERRTHTFGTPVAGTLVLSP